MSEKLKKQLRLILFGPEKPDRQEIKLKDILVILPFCFVFFVGFYFLRAPVDWYLPPLNVWIVSFFLATPFLSVFAYLRWPKYFSFMPPKEMHKISLCFIYWALSLLLFFWFYAYCIFNQGFYYPYVWLFDGWFGNPYSLFILAVVLSPFTLAWKLRREEKWNVGLVFLYLMMSGFFVVSISGAVNIYFDGSKPQVFDVEVKKILSFDEGKKEYGHFGTEYELEVRSLDPLEKDWIWEDFFFSVPRDIYYEVGEGNRVCIYKYPGALGVEWVQVGYCP